MKDYTMLDSNTQDSIKKEVYSIFKKEFSDMFFNSFICKVEKYCKENNIEYDSIDLLKMFYELQYSCNETFDFYSIINFNRFFNHE